MLPISRFVVNEVELLVGKEARPLGQLDELLLFIPIGDDQKGVYGDQQLTANKEFARRRFLSAAEWFVKNQQEDGSWRVEAKRVFTSRIYLKPGWCSAMGQGESPSTELSLGSILLYTGICQCEVHYLALTMKYT